MASAQLVAAVLELEAPTWSNWLRGVLVEHKFEDVVVLFGRALDAFYHVPSVHELFFAVFVDKQDAVI